MIPRLASPSVCVIDDEEEDYRPILEALRRLGLGCVHIKGVTGLRLPKRSLRGIRLVFTDLHLGNLVGTAAASHTANVFKKIIPDDTAPTVVIIWSKYADDTISDATRPPSDQPTEADLFKSTLLQAVPSFQDRLIFCEMKKPKPGNRPSGNKWITRLKADIQREIAKVPGFELLWTWESFVRDVGMALTESLTRIILPSTTTGGNHGAAANASLHESLRLGLRILVREQGGLNCSPTAAPQHLASLLAQTLADQIEHSEELKSFSKHARWLSDQKGLPDRTPLAPGINGLLLTAALSEKSALFVPGSVYRFTKSLYFEKLFGVAFSELVEICYNGPVTKLEEWKSTTNVQPVLVEVSAACDVQQGTRRNAMLIGGLIFPEAASKTVKRSDGLEKLPLFSLRWPIKNFFTEQHAFLVFCSRYRVTMSCKREPRWLIPWFRLRELPTASLRNWQASHASRVGYVSLR